MKTEIFDLFVQYSEEIKFLHSPVIHNIFLDANILRKITIEKECAIYKIKNSMFLLIPRHNIYYDVLYMSTDTSALKESIKIFIHEYHHKYQLRISVIGHEKSSDLLAGILNDCGFRLGKKIARMRNLGDERDLKHLIELLCDEKIEGVEFAKKEDAQGVFDLIMTEFDIRSDNIPELCEIEENISKNQVVVIKNNNKVVALHYFTIKNSCAYGWYDITSKEYRQSHMYLHISLFLYNYWKDKNKIVRSYSWRDIANKRLMNLARQSNQVPDGVYIYNMIYDFPICDTSLSEFL